METVANREGLNCPGVSLFGPWTTTVWLDVMDNIEVRLLQALSDLRGKTCQFGSMSLGWAEALWAAHYFIQRLRVFRELAIV